MHREVRIDGDLKVRLFSWTPRAEINRLYIAQPSWAASSSGAGSNAFAEVQQLIIAVDLKRLLVFQLVLPEVRLEQPNLRLIRDVSGRANWNFDENRINNQPFRLPAIRHFVIRDGKLTLNDAQKNLIFAGTISSEERDSAGGNQFFSIVGQGELNRAPFSAQVKGDPLLNIQPSRPYAFEGHVRAGGTRVDAKGSLNKPFDLGALQVSASFAGPDLADLYYLTGLTLPNTPQYQLSGSLTRDRNLFRFHDFGGKLGGSDIHGELTVDASGKKPYLKADLASKKLNFDDLGPLIGARPSGTPAIAAASANAKTAAATVVAAAPAGILPDAPLKVERLRQMDADVHYRADAVASRDFPLRAAETTLSLKDGVLKLTPVSFAFAHGTLKGDVQIDARKDVPVSDIDVRLAGLQLEQFMAGSSGSPPFEGTAVARAKLRGVGDSIHKAASTADGTVSFVVPHGEIRQAFAEALGINVANALGLLLTGDQTEVDVRCAAASFSAQNGTMRLGQFALDTPVVLATGEGTIDLKREQMNLAISGHPKKPQLIRLRAPITVTGSLGHPAIGVEPGTAIAQGGLAVGLAVALSPLAAILPFIDPGLGKDAPCATLIGQAKAQGAPVPQSQVRR